ncbi:MAPEG family protein [Sphingorhabdus sp. IMCC26285]|jgi:hypothetical protein|uniref:MAPEG family protein n=1 Tax=Sphingorhabdus profundilacus TaxID=2509718 RepID=A0A6I4LVU3_9SPHN|nr:MAPEG family protein [Sphingorhabdus profundilacus]MVZ96979.1 MAPEG family protein [Sphingorhabdus profundilacus]
MDTSILAPAAVLVAWSLVMLLWMAATRFPAIFKSGMDLKAAPPGGRGQDLEAVLPANVNWKSHNYTHLMEQPTIFYAAVLIIAVAGASTPSMVNLAWGYTILRIIHSLYQSLFNVVMVRFSIFVLATICLVVLAVHAVIATI